MAGTIDPNRPNFAFNVDDVTVGDDADAAETKSAKNKETAAAAQSTEPSPDVIVNTPPPPNLQPPSGGPQPGDDNDPIRTDAVGASRRPDPAATAAMFEDVRTALMEPAMEMLFAKLMQESGGKKDSIDDQVKQINAQIVACKKEIVKLEVVMQKIDELMPKFQAFMKEEAAANQQCVKPDMSAQEHNFATMLGEELKKAGIDISPDKLDKLVQGLGDAAGSPAAEMLAMFLITTIAKADGAKATADPKLNDPNADISQFDPNDPANAGRDPKVLNAAPTAVAGEATAGSLDAAPSAATATLADAPTPDTTQTSAATDPQDPSSNPVELPPEAAAAGFDTQSFTERINQIADLAARMVKDDNEWAFAFLGPIGGVIALNNAVERNQAAAELMLAIMPGMTLDGDLPLNPALADAKANGTEAAGFTFSPETIAMAVFIFPMPFGTGPAATSVFLQATLDKQLSDKVDKLTAQIAALQQEVKKLMVAGPAQDAELQRLGSDLKKAIAALHAQRDTAVAQVTDLLGSGQANIEQVQQAFVGAITGALEALAAELSAMTTSQSVGAPMIR